MEIVDIIKMGINGEGIAYRNHKPIFVTGALPQEKVEIEITEENDRFAKAETISVLNKSKYRITPPCPYNDVCGACSLMILDHKEQCYQKKKLLEEALYKYANISRDLIRDVHTNDQFLGYRTQCKMPVQMSHDVLTTGLYTAGTNHFHPMETCPVQDEQLEKTRMQILKVLNEFHYPAFDFKTNKGIRYLVIRTIQGKSQCTLVTGKDILPTDLVQQLMKIEGMYGIFQSINTERKGTEIFGSSIRKLAGEKQISVDIGNITLNLSPRSFFQLNLEEAKELYQMAVSKIDPCDTLVEAYSGVGAMSLLASDKAKHVIGIESMSEAVINAIENAEMNHINNVDFICDDAANGLLEILKETKVNTLLADPSRTGMNDQMIRTILSSSIEKIIYVSCNPATLGKNIKDLSSQYHVVTVIPFDMFPNTPHIESITVLVRNGTKKQKRKYYHKKHGGRNEVRNARKSAPHSNTGNVRK